MDEATDVSRYAETVAVRSPFSLATPLWIKNELKKKLNGFEMYQEAVYLSLFVTKSTPNFVCVAY